MTVNRGVFPFPALGAETMVQAGKFIIGRFRVEHEGVVQFAFDGVPQSFNHLELAVMFRTTSTAAPNGPLYLRFNGDTGTNYGYQTMYGQGSTSATGGGSFQENSISSVPIGYGGTTATPAIVCVSTTWIPFYANVAFPKRFVSTMAYQRTIQTISAYWDRNAPIQSLELSTSTAGGNSFWIGSEFILYGVL
jgi:hypothetical protein